MTLTDHDGFSQLTFVTPVEDDVRKLDVVVSDEVVVEPQNASSQLLEVHFAV